MRFKKQRKIHSNRRSFDLNFITIVLYVIKAKKANLILSWNKNIKIAIIGTVRKLD